MTSGDGVSMVGDSTTLTTGVRGRKDWAAWRERANASASRAALAETSGRESSGSTDGFSLAAAMISSTVWACARTRGGMG